MGDGKGSQPLLGNTKNTPKGHVSGVEEQGSGWEDVFDVRGGMRKMLNMTNMLLRVCLSGSA